MKPDAEVAQELVSVAAGLAVAVADRNYITARDLLVELDRRETDILAVVLASLVDVSKPLVVDKTLLVEEVSQHELDERWLRRILKHVADVYNVEASVLLQGGRNPQVTEARQVMYWVARAEGYSYPAIGRFLSRDHTSVMIGVRRVNRDPRLKALSTVMQDSLRRKVSA